MKKEIFEILMNSLDRMFSMSVNKKEKETDYNDKIFKMIKENDLPAPFRELTIENQLILVTGKNVSVRFAMKIQELKNRLGGNVTDKQLYRIISFLKEDEGGKLYVNLSKTQIMMIRSYFIIIFIAIIYGVKLFWPLSEHIHDLNSFLFFCLGLFFYYGFCLFFLNLMGKEQLAIIIKKKIDKLR
ncbi:hypothetical protein [Chryseobacterium sp. 2987]|uniref:hypothetical protein n=1 Tax=Chryseobacterium sp. 2987 TaxID=2817767 RepID=UPI002859A19C|nr:hypothetical protein [Chryseobacterium sp. 2987]MDR6921784.1 hypothetical protein [Chryseobacterium sp. 2987]